jgi:hypothetical protein
LRAALRSPSVAVIICLEEAVDALPLLRWQSDPGLSLIVASSLEYVSSDWVAVEVSAVVVVLPECACGRQIAAYHRSAVSSFGDQGGGRGDHHAVATPHAWRQGRSWRNGHRRPSGNEGAVLGAVYAAGAWLAFVQ